MAARFVKPTDAKIVALLDKATPENTKNATKYGVNPRRHEGKKVTQRHERSQSDPPPPPLLFSKVFNQLT